MSARLDATVTGPQAAPVVVLGSSLGTTREMWASQAPALSQRFRVVAFDHRGHGRSAVPSGPYAIDDLGSDVLALLDGLGVERFSYAGLSLGGMVGMWLAATVPDRVDRLALLCTSAYLGGRGYGERAALVRRAGLGDIADAVVGRWFTAPFAADRPDVVDEFRAMLVATPPEGYAGCCEALAAMDLRPRLADVVAPTLVIAGEEDAATPPAHAEDIVGRLRDAQLVVLPEAAHLANVEQPDAVTNLLVRHLRGD